MRTRDSFRKDCRPIAAILLVQALVLGWGAWRHSPTYDELAHLPAGVRHWQKGEFELFRVNPPLVRMIAAIPVMIAGVETDWTRLEKRDASTRKRLDFLIATDFVNVNGERAFWLYTIARWACIPLAMLGGFVCWMWARDLYGGKAGGAAALLWVSAPLVLGHGQLITPDVPAASIGAFAFYTFWKWLRQGTWKSAFVAGVALGVAELTKTTWVIAGPLMIGIACCCHKESFGGLCRWFGQLSSMLFFAWFILLAGYGFDGVFDRLGDYRFTSQALSAKPAADPDGNRFIGTILEDLPVPLPRQFVIGVDVQKTNFEKTTHSYLRGELREHGWWYYYLYAVGVKATIGTLGLLAIASCMRFLHCRWPTRDEWVLLLPMLIITTLVSSQTGINKHLRYLLPAYPFALIWSSQVFRVKNALMSRLAIGLLSASMVSSLWISPHSLSYFNEIVGGPRNGTRHLLNSNVDWGQDLFFLRDELDRRKWKNVEMVYWGRYDASLIGIDFSMPPATVLGGDIADAPKTVTAPRAGRYAIGANQLCGYPFVSPDGVGGIAVTAEGAYQYFKQFKPIGTAGYSMFLFELTDDDVEPIRSSLNLDSTETLALSEEKCLVLSSDTPLVGCVSQSSSSYIVGSRSGEIKEYSIPELQETSRFSYEHPCTALSVSPDGTSLAAGFMNGTLLTWVNFADGQLPADPTWTHSFSGDKIGSIEFSPNASRVAFFCDNTNVEIADARDGTISTSIDVGLAVSSLAWIDERRIAVGTGDWKTNTRGDTTVYSDHGEMLGSLENSHHFIIDLVVHPNRGIIGRSTNGMLGQWDSESYNLSSFLFSEAPRPLALSKNSKWMIAGDSRGRVLIWNLIEQALVFDKQLMRDRILDVGFIDDQAKSYPAWAVGLGRDRTMRLFRVKCKQGKDND